MNGAAANGFRLASGFSLTRTLSSSARFAYIERSAVKVRRASSAGNQFHLPKFELGCSSDRDAKPSIGIVIVTYDSKVTDVPMAPGTYPIAAKASPAKNKPGQFIVANLIFGETMFEGKSGTLKLERFDAEGAKGSFTIDGNEILFGSRPLHIEGTFDMPCRREMLQGACKSDKAEHPK